MDIVYLAHDTLLPAITVADANVGLGQDLMIGVLYTLHSQCTNSALRHDSMCRPKEEDQRWLDQPQHEPRKPFCKCLSKGSSHPNEAIPGLLLFPAEPLKQ